MRYFSSLMLLPLLALAEDPDKNLITIQSVSHSGNGCPQGSMSTTFSPDKTVITAGFDQFQTYIGPGTTPMDKTKNCQLHHGFAQLDEGVTGTFYSTFFFSSDAAKTSTTQSSIRGGGVWADGQVYTKQETLPAANIVRSPCGGSTAILNINNRIALTSSDRDASGMISNDDATASLTQQIHIDWVKC